MQGLPAARALLAGAAALALVWPGALGAAIGEERAQEGIGQYSADELQRQVDADLGAALGEEFPELRFLLGAGYRPGQDGGTAQAAGAALSKLLGSAKGASASRRAVLLLAADSLLERFPGEELFGLRAPRGKVFRRTKVVAGYRLSYHWAPLGAAWVYQRTLLWDVWRALRTTDWGELAFALLLLHGWDTSGVCAKGHDQFQSVIREGERFLARRPQSLYRTEVLVAVAQAYETWWSLAHAPADEDYVDRPQYQGGAPRARERALQYYGHLSQQAAETFVSRYAGRKLAAIQSGRDTRQRIFYCTYD